MSTNPPDPTDRLSPSWIRRAISKKQKPAQDENSKQTTSKGLLSPRPASASSASDDSRSAGSSKFGRRGSIREMVNRIRSPSNASLASNKSQDQELGEIDNWFYGFRRYNQLISAKALSDSSQDLAKTQKALSKNCGGHFLHGLPEAAFDLSLLWCPAGNMSRKDTDEPSWSWQAFDGPLNFPFDPTTSPDIYTIPRSEGDWFRSEIVNFHIGPPETPYTVRREKAKSLRTSFPSYFHAPRGSDASIESNTLRFTTSVISADGFTVEQLHHNNKDIPCSQLLNEQGQHCGVIMDYQSAISEPSSTGPYEFILLSRNLCREPAEHTRRPTHPAMHPSGTPIWNSERFLWDEVVVDSDDELFAPGPWKMLNVMLIRWVGECAERVAIARIHEDAWAQLDSRREDVVLR